MSEAADAHASAWADAALAAALFAVDPRGTGACLRAMPGPLRDAWVALVRRLLPGDGVVRRLPSHISDSRLLGGLDLTATLQAGRPVAERGVLAEAHGGVVVVAMAERLGAGVVAKLAAVMDAGVVALQRDGLALELPARFGVIALDEGLADDERPLPALRDRLAFHLQLDQVPLAAMFDTGVQPEDVVQARARVDGVRVDNAALEAICATAQALGVDALRASLAAVRVARACAALNARENVDEEDIVIAARLVLAPRATRLPAPPDDETQPEEPQDRDADDPPPHEEGDDTEDPPEPPSDGPLADVVLEAALAAIPAGLLAQLQAGRMRRSPTSGRAGAVAQSALRGRPIGARRGDPRAGARLDLLETLRAAAPWQRLRARERARTRRVPRVDVRREDFRIRRFKQHSATATIFAVDASGSAALHRLAEAKGAVELLLADCYVRRDSVALIAFRGANAELLLPPTRSLARAKRCLAGLPGGGGTPLAAALEVAGGLADSLRRKGDTPFVVFLTDGRANIARDGSPGRERAEQDALAAARVLRAANVSAMLIDTSPRPNPSARQVADEMGARYLPLPHADAGSLSTAIRAAAPAADR